MKKLSTALSGALWSAGYPSCRDNKTASKPRTSDAPDGGMPGLRPFERLEEALVFEPYQ